MDAPAPLSQSRVWELQRAFYEDNASEAFAEIPHQIVDNPFVAAAFARVVVGYLRDVARGGLDLDEPLYIVELGAGPGRFAHGFMRELGAFVEALPFALPPIRYLLTDLGERTVRQWASNPALADGRFEFARFDVAGEEGLELGRVANPLVVIANYVFDSIPADAFAISGGGVQECLVSVEGTDVASMRPVFSRGPARSYDDPDLDALLEHYRTQLDGTVITLPHVAIGCVRRLRELAGDRLLLLAADKTHSTEASLAQRSEPELSVHGGSFSLMVNFHALAWYAERHGGAALHGGDRHMALDVVALLFGSPPGGHAETRLAYTDTLDRFGPEDLSFLAEGIERVAPQLSLAELVALLRLSGWDAFTLLGVAGQLREQAAEADPAAQDGLREALLKTYERHFPVPGEADLPFTIGVLLFELEDYEEAIEFFEASLEQHGPDEATERNIDICESQLRR
ncbi:SAM-dependent methyltransferase [Solirubrobacter taibaiensis]|nr:SAM-dependent methyltransferase [Solirubrobacter taibaiensis]